MPYADPAQRTEYQRGYRKRRMATPKGVALDHAAQKRYRSKPDYHAKIVNRKYNLGEGGYEAMLENQTLDGEKFSRCAICMNRAVTRRLAVDHNHLTGLSRGTLLCVNCNKNLGQWENDPIRCYNLILYLWNIIEELGGLPEPEEVPPEPPKVVPIRYGRKVTFNDQG